MRTSRPLFVGSLAGDSMLDQLDGGKLNNLTVHVNLFLCKFGDVHVSAELVWVLKDEYDRYSDHLNNQNRFSKLMSY